jgi:hypothetical protein
MSTARYVAVVLLIGGFVWWLVIKQFGEGPTLWHYAEGHALMLTDLLSVAGWAVAVMLWLLPRQHRFE